MTLSSRAERYLAALPRGSFVPVERLAEALQQAGCLGFDTWLDFHARYAGYEEELGLETAVWGIVHDSPIWLDPGEATVERDGARWYVVCADVHPSFDYSLYSDGEFSSTGGGGRCESFDIKVERSSVLWEATAGGRSWELDFELARVAKSSPEALREWAGGEIVVEASDRYATCWRARDIIVIQRAETVTAWTATDACERIGVYLRRIAR